MQFPRMPIEEESPEQLGYDKIKFNLTESSVRDRTLAERALHGDDDLALAFVGGNDDADLGNHQSTVRTGVKRSTNARSSGRARAFLASWDAPCTAHA